MIYDENSESVINVLLRIFDNGNNASVETNFNTVENIDKASQRKETVVGVRGTKRKKSDVSIKKDGKYQCQQCDYKNNCSSNLRKHVTAKHDGVRYSCDKCDYRATQQQNLKKHKEYKHEGVRYPCDKCDYNEPSEIT